MTVTQKQDPSISADTISTADSTIAIGAPVIERTAKLTQLLESVPSPVDTVYVADNGNIADRTDLYARDWPFRLDVIDLPYDVGIGKCRREIADACETDYLAVVDSDMELPANLGILAQILEADDSLGAVGGILNEPAGLRSGCCNLHTEEMRHGKTALVQAVRGDPEIETVAGYPIARFDKLANAMLVRQKCLDDYTWDPTMGDKEHLDWFIGQRVHDWEFAVCPSAVFKHNCGTHDAYREQFRTDARSRHFDRRLCEKWGYRSVVWGDDRWFGTQRRPISVRLAKAAHRHLPFRYWYPIKRAAKAVLQR